MTELIELLMQLGPDAQLDYLNYLISLQESEDKKEPQPSYLPEAPKK